MVSQQYYVLPSVHTFAVTTPVTFATVRPTNGDMNAGPCMSVTLTECATVAKHAAKVKADHISVVCTVKFAREHTNDSVAMVLLLYIFACLPSSQELWKSIEKVLSANVQYNTRS
jgi:hypothetical protein